MPDKIIRIAPTGNMDKDSDVRYVGKGDRKGDTVENRNTQFESDSGESQGDLTPTLGNELAFSLGEVSPQNKKYRITVSGDEAITHKLKFLSTKKDINILNGTGTDGELEFGGTIGSLENAFNAAVATSSVTWSYTVSGNTLEVELTYYNYYQWYLESTGADPVEVVCIQEAIPVDLAGPLKDIGSYDLLGDLFVFSTTQDSEPANLGIDVIGLGPVSSGLFTGPLTTITFNADHNLVVGQWIRIADSDAPWLIGLFLVQEVTSSIGISIVTDTAWGATHPVFPAGNEIITVNPTGIGEIGVAQKDENTDSWVYTRLLRSVELNFVSIHPIDCHAHVDAAGLNLYYTDDYNAPRKLKYIGGYVLDGALKYILPDNEYEYGIISKQSALVLVSPAIEFVFIEQLQSGGSLIAGNKYYVARLVFAAGDNSNWSSLSRAVNVYKEGINSSSSLLSGNNSIETPKSNKLRIEGLNPILVDRIEIAVIEDISGVLTASIIKKVNVSSSSVTFIHSGNEEDVELVDVATLLPSSDSLTPIRAKNIRAIDSRNVLSNIETLSKIDLTEWVRTFRHSIKTKEIGESTKYQKGEYQKPENTFNNVGFMYNETYRIGCRAYIKGLGRTDVFWVDDIRVDTNVANPANPFGDNRRNNTISNYDLSRQVVTPAYGILDSANLTEPGIGTGSPLDPSWTDQIGVAWIDGWRKYANREFYNDDNGDPLNMSSISFLIVPYINIEDIDYSFNITQLGIPASEAIESLEFFIADIPNSVKASGVGVMSVETPDNPIISPIPTDGDALFNSGGPVDHIMNITDRSILSYPKWPSDKYIIEYPYATGSTAQVDTSLNFINIAALNYPVKSYPIGEKYTERRDFISFYSGDTVFNDKENYAGKELIVFGVCDLQNNFRVQKDVFSSQYISAGGTTVRGASLWAKFSPRLTLSTYTSYSINSQEYVDPEKLPAVTGLSYNDNSGAPNHSLWLATGSGPTSGDLFAASIGGDSFSKRLPVIFKPVVTGLIFVINNLWHSIHVDTVMNNQRGPVIKLDTPINLNDANISPSFVNEYETLRYSNRGVVYCQIYTDESEFLPEISDTEYISIGSMLLTPLGAPNSDHSLVCGDTYTQTSILKHRSPGATIGDLAEAESGLDVSLINDPPAGIEGNESIVAKELYETGFGSGLIATCQNRINANMFTVEESLDSDQLYYPKDDTKDWLNAYSFETIPAYNAAYNSLSNILIPGYETSDLLGRVKYDFPTRIVWSILKDQSGIKDEYRIFLPLSLKDLDLTFGEIDHHEDVNGELFTQQSRKYQLQYFNARGTLQGSNSSVDILLGSGDVLSRDGKTLSSYGTTHKWASIKGASANGKDVIYWFNSENGLMMRFGADGTRVISERGMSAFFVNYTKWAKNKYEHAFNEGVRGVWDDRRKEAIWTFTAWRTLSQWIENPSLKMKEGSAVVNDNSPTDTYEEFPRFFKVIVTHAATSATEPGVGVDWEDYWEQISYDNSDYYSIFTVAFNEITNGFRCFYGHIPKTYLKWGNTFLSSHPIHRNLIFEHRKGNPTIWYGRESGTPIPPKIEDAYFESVVNELPEQSVRGVAVAFLTENVPDRVDYRTQRQYTFDEAAQFERRDDSFFAPIRNDATATGNPDSDDGMLSGSYLRVKFTIFGGTYNLLHSIVVKIRDRIRRINT